MLLKLGPDEKVVNYSLMAFAMKLEKERVALNSKLEGAPETEANDIRTKRDSYAKLLETLLTDLAKREKMDPRHLIWIARTAGLLGLDNMAAEMANKILARCKTDPDFNKAIEDAKAIRLLRDVAP